MGRRRGSSVRDTGLSCDLGDVWFVDLAGLRVLLDAAARAGQAGGGVTITNCPPIVTRMLDLQTCVGRVQFRRFGTRRLQRWSRGGQLVDKESRSGMSERRESELRLFREYHATRDPRARDVIVERFMPLARSLARRYHRGSEPLEDLEQVAYLALVKAVDGFDPSFGTAFSSYAVPSIAGGLKRHFRDYGWSVRVPRDLQERALRVEHIHDELFALTGQSPTAQEIARQAGVSVEEVLEARAAFGALHSSSLEQPQPGRGGQEPLSLLETLGEPDAGIDRAVDRAALSSVIGSLDEREQTIVQLYYRGELTQAEIGHQLGYSQMHVSRLLRQAVEQLTAAADAQDVSTAHSSAQAARAADGVSAGLLRPRPHAASL